MGLGFSSNKSNSKSSTNQTQTTTPTNPAWVEPQVQSLANLGMSLASADPHSYVAGADPLQTQAAATASGLGAGNANFNAAGTLFGQAGSGGAAAYNPAMASATMMGPVANMTGAQASPFIQQYMSPYTNDVVNSALKDYDFGAGQTQAQNKLALAGDSTFGGSGGAIQTAMSNDAINRGRGTLSADLNNQGFQTALGAAQSDAERAQQANLTNYQGALTQAGANQNASNQFGLANQNANNTAWQFNAGQQDNNLNRMLQAGQGLTGLGTAQDANTRANATTQADIGSILQQIAQQKAQAPLDAYGSIAGAYSGLPLSLFNGSTKNLTGTTKGSSLSFGADASFSGK